MDNSPLSRWLARAVILLWLIRQGPCIGWTVVANGDVILVNIDRFVLANVVDQCIRQRNSGGIGRMDNAAIAVPALPGQMKHPASIWRGLFGEGATSVMSFGLINDY